MSQDIKHIMLPIIAASLQLHVTFQLFDLADNIGKKYIWFDTIRYKIPFVFICSAVSSECIKTLFNLRIISNN